MGKAKKNNEGIERHLNSTCVGEIFNTDKLDLRNLSKNGVFYSAKQKKIIVDKLKIREGFGDKVNKINLAFILQDKLKESIFTKYMLDAGFIFNDYLFNEGGIFFQKEQECLDELSVISFQKINSLEKTVYFITNTNLDASEQNIAYLKKITSEYLKSHYKNFNEINLPKQFICVLNQEIGFGLKLTLSQDLEVQNKSNVSEEDIYK